MLIYVDFTPAGYQPENIEEDFIRRETSAIQEFQQGLNIQKKNILPTLDTPDRDDDILDILIVTANGDPVRITLPVTRKEVVENAELLWGSLADYFSLDNSYMPYASNMYEWLIAPVETELQKQDIEITNLLFVLPTEIRFTPLAALYDAGEDKFLVEKYSSGLAPSINLNENTYRPVQKLNMLAMGASNFTDQEVEPLPAVSIELETIKQIWEEEQQNEESTFINEEFTLDQIKSELANNSYGIVHFGTHGEFQPGDVNNSYIQLYDSRLNLPDMRTLGLDDPLIELLVLSACETAFGDDIAELGFAGLAVQSGVKTAVGSVWLVSDTGTLALMTEFYSQLRSSKTKAEALRQAQLNLLKGNVYKTKDETGASLRTPELQVPLDRLPEDTQVEEDLSHPFYWAPFTMIGNPW